MKIYHLLFLILLLTSCATTNHIQNTFSVPTIENRNLEKSNTIFQHESWSQTKDRPTLGIALSGGGSKSAPFAMGVLKRFVDENWLSQVDIISSVSGGGYSAYYLYSKSLYSDQNNNIPLKEFFRNYELDELYKIKSYKKYEAKLASIPNKKLYSHLDHVKKHQDLLSIGESEEARGGTISDNIESVRDVFISLFSSLMFAPHHHLSNTLFDWKVEIVPSQSMYERGIIRGFGNNGQREQFSNLRKITEEGKVPLWIINASNFESYWYANIFSKKNKNLSKSIFEVTPFGFGSGRYQYSIESPDSIGLDIPRSVLGSAAFFDALGGSKLLFSGLHIINLRWGIKIPHYSSSSFHQKIHNLLPFPLYYLDSKGSKITLADGGQSGDNLGVYSLIKRGTKNIVIVSGSDDFLRKHGIIRTDKLKLEDMCKVASFLNTKNLDIFFKGIPSDLTDEKTINFYNEFCNGGKLHKTTSYYDWKKPVWKGFISDRKTKKQISNLFFIKAAMDENKLTKESNLFRNNMEGNWDSFHPSPLLYFWCNSDRTNNSAGFPQTTTFVNTLNSSQNLFQAYMSLGYYLSSFLDGNELVK